jgi:hypothetical protein
MTAYESTTAWRAKLKSMREKFETSQAEASSALTSATSDHVMASNDIIARIAMARIQAEAKAKAESDKKLATSGPIDTSRADLKDSMFSDSDSGQLDSGTKVDLKKDTITLSNGKVIDIRTGQKVFDFTT